MTSPDHPSDSSADVPISLTQRLETLGQHAGLREVFLFRITRGRPGNTIQLLLRHPAVLAQPPVIGRGMRRALQIAADTANPFITVRRAPRNGKASTPDSARAEALMVAPVLTFDNMIWGALVGVGPVQDATALAFRAMIQTAQQIGGQISAWGRARAPDGPAPVNAQLRVSLGSSATLLHELRTPLSASIFALDTLEQAHIETADERVQRAFRTLREALTEATQVIQWWTETQQRGQTQPYTSPVSIEAALRESLTLIPHAPARTHITIDEQTPLVLADALMLNRVFLNLIDNAFRHGQPGGILEVTTRAADSAVSVRFLNHGVIPDAALEEILRPSPKPNGRAENRTHGYGLGIVSALINQMGGVVAVESDWHTWTAFTVTLPAASHAARQLLTPSEEG